MKALLLAGGFGTRLRPLTLTRPKHLLPIANRPHIEHVFDLLLAHGIEGVVLLTSYLADAFEGAVASAEGRGLAVEVTHEQEPLGTAGALKNAQALVGGGTFLVFNGDILTDCDLGRVLEWHRMKQAEATIWLQPVPDPSAFGVVPTDRDGRVLGFVEKPPPGSAPTNLINAGIYVFEPTVLDRIPAGEVWSAERQLFPGLVEEGAPVFGISTDAYWMDIGTPPKFLAANLDALEGRFRTESVPHPGAGLVLRAPGAQVEEGARISSVCLGADASVASGAVVESSVLLPGAKVERDAVVRRSIIGDGARVAQGVTVEDETMAPGEHDALS
ncbi:MAG TPA: NDP-sugar synthase [Actinomycetota bacterium]|nr:NDP-sugar synthase [Actinomycetota bacterium]